MYNVAIVGATGNVGRMFLKILAERSFPIKNLYLFASKRSAGKTIQFEGKDYVIEETCDETINSKTGKLDFALFSAGGDASLEFAAKFAKTGAVVIDNSSTWRMDPKVPLVVPEVNPEDIKWHNGIIANPNCSTIQAMPVLKALQDTYGIKRVVYSTYQAVSGAGIQAIEDLENGYKGIAPKKFPYPITGNVLPHIDVFEENGYTKEEMKMINETQKILHDDTLRITATTARVPVLNSHSESINVELDKKFEVSDIFKLLGSTKGVTVYDNVDELKYPTPLEVTGKDDVYVGRIRRDFSIDNGLNLWVVGDNIRKGAALNAVQIAELMIESK
ncbi:aspartate-semialdehyde dehydrogenase [Clostridium vincentii]|uniref:Aspartate-semialdehyde dehydrogenase n=1 Tax=Clostridium vincentii TaxID=52704 RepID=A0A2T0BDJ0_9CLOT|nr:aspartate-semialdehyde dehydrogenase [Clostridium vincentii]PRR81925.1 Aspartate-semialdehyde dehydrogenase [Clostridium vincentii]